MKAPIRIELDTFGGCSRSGIEIAKYLAPLKPLIFAKNAASAGMTILAAAETSIVAPDATLGSIGSKIAIYDFSEKLNKDGIKVDLMQIGSLKTAYESQRDTPLTEQEKEELQSLLERDNMAMTDFIASQRSIDKSVISELQAKILTPSQAKEFGLVDILSQYANLDMYLSSEKMNNIDIDSLTAKLTAEISNQVRKEMQESQTSATKTALVQSIVEANALVSGKPLSVTEIAAFAGKDINELLSIQAALQAQHKAIKTSLAVPVSEVGAPVKELSRDEIIKQSLIKEFNEKAKEWKV